MKTQLVQTKGLVIYYKKAGGLQNGKIAGLKLFAPPPPQDSKTSHTPSPFNEWKPFAHSLQYG